MIDKIENLSIVVGTLIGINNIETIMGIVLLGFQLLLVIFKVILKIKQSLKDKKLTAKEKQEIQNSIDETLAIIDDMEEKFKNNGGDK